MVARAGFCSQRSPADSYAKYRLMVRGKRQSPGPNLPGHLPRSPRGRLLRSLRNDFAPDLNKTGSLPSNILISFLALPQPITSCIIPVFTPNRKNGEWNIATKGVRWGSKDWEGGGGGFKKEKGEKIFAVPFTFKQLGTGPQTRMTKRKCKVFTPAGVGGGAFINNYDDCFIYLFF